MNGFLFIVIGALIVGIAYFIGSSDYTAEAVDDKKFWNVMFGFCLVC